MPSTPIGAPSGASRDDCTSVPRVGIVGVVWNVSLHPRSSAFGSAPEDTEILARHPVAGLSQPSMMPRSSVSNEWPG